LAVVDLRVISKVCFNVKKQVLFGRYCICMILHTPFWWALKCALK